MKAEDRPATNRVSKGAESGRSFARLTPVVDIPKSVRCCPLEPQNINIIIFRAKSSFFSWLRPDHRTGPLGARTMDPVTYEEAKIAAEVALPASSLKQRMDCSTEYLWPQMPLTYRKH